MRTQAVAKAPKTEEMLAGKWAPMRMFDDLRNEMEALWRWPSTRPALHAEAEWMPTVDVYREKDKLIVKADLPGMNKADIDVAIEEGDLILRGERKMETKVEEESYYRAERSYGSFYRRMALPENVKPADIKAKFDNGVLTVTLPLPKVEHKAEHIAVS